jgi:hypothetical protein
MGVLGSCRGIGRPPLKEAYPKKTIFIGIDDPEEFLNSGDSRNRIVPMPLKIGPLLVDPPHVRSQNISRLRDRVLPFSLGSSHACRISKISTL